MKIDILLALAKFDMFLERFKYVKIKFSEMDKLLHNFDVMEKQLELIFDLAKNEQINPNENEDYNRGIKEMQLNILIELAKVS